MKLRATCLAIVLALGCTEYAHAQPKQTEASAVDPAARDKSRAAFRKGVTQLRAQDYNGARTSFEEAYSLVQHPSILLNLGIARLKTGDPVLAEEDLTKFLSEDSGAAADELASARDALAEAKKQIGNLKLTVTPATAHVTIDGAGVTLRDGVSQTRHKAGSHTVSIDAEGFTPVEKTAEIPARGETKLAVDLVAKAAGPAMPPPGGDKSKDAEGTSLRPILGYSLAGVSGVALVVTGVFGLKALSLSSEYSDRNTAPASRPELKSDGESARTSADVALVIALLAGAGAVILLFTDIGASHEPAPSTAPPKAASRWQGFPATIRW